MSSGSVRSSILEANIERSSVSKRVHFYRENFQSYRSATTNGCELFHVDGLNFMMEMNRARLWTSRWMYSPFFMPDMRNSLAPWQRAVNDDDERNAAWLPDRFLSKIDVSIEFSFCSIVYSFFCRDPCASIRPSLEANHRLEQYSRIQMFPFRNRTWHRLTVEPDREKGFSAEGEGSDRTPYQIGYFGYVDHRIDIISALDESDTALATYVCESTSVQSVFTQRKCSPETTVTGPRISVNFCRVKFLMRHFIRRLLPTFPGPTRATMTGGGSSGVRSTSGRCIRFSLISCVLNRPEGVDLVQVRPLECYRRKSCWAFTGFWMLNALGLRRLASSKDDDVLSFGSSSVFFLFRRSAFTPVVGLRNALRLSSIWNRTQQ